MAVATNSLELIADPCLDEPVAGPEWPIRSDLNGRLIGGHPVSLVVRTVKVA